MSEKNTSSKQVVGIDLGGTNMQFGVVNSHFQITGRATRKTGASDGPDGVIGRLIEGVEEACKNAGLMLDEVVAVGIAAAGAMDIPNGIILNAPNLGWIDLPLRDILTDKLGKQVVLENDVNGAVYGEYKLGAAKGEGDVLGVWVGTGVGGGLVLNGKIYHGSMHTAGEIGHTVLDIHAEVSARKLEEICSRTGMSRSIAKGLKDHTNSSLQQCSKEELNNIDTAILKEAYDKQDALALEVINNAAELLGIAIANWVTVLSLDTVIIGGGITEVFGEPYLSRIRQSFNATVFPDRCRACRLIPTELQENAGLLGAALLAHDMASAK